VIYEDWGQEEHPNVALLQDHPEINQLCCTILAEFFEEPQCLHSTSPGALSTLVAPSSKTVSPVVEGSGSSSIQILIDGDPGEEKSSGSGSKSQYFRERGLMLGLNKFY
jgi:hypothetical protein